jgi:hypothetical protein
MAHFYFVPCGKKNKNFYTNIVFGMVKNQKKFFLFCKKINNVFMLGFSFEGSGDFQDVLEKKYDRQPESKDFF